MDSPKTLFPSTPEKNLARQEQAATARKVSFHLFLRLSSHLQTLWDMKVEKAHAEIEKAKDLAEKKKESGVIDVPISTPSKPGIPLFFFEFVLLIAGRLPAVHQRLVNSPKTLFPSSPAQNQARQEKAAAIRKVLIAIFLPCWFDSFEEPLGREDLQGSRRS